MTNEEALQTMLRWAWDFGCDIIEANEEAFPEDQKEARGMFRKVWREGEGQVMEIWLKTDLPLKEKVEVMAHEIGHMALFLLKVNPSHKLTREPVADLLGKCLLAIIWEDYGNPLFKIGRVYELVKEFLELLKGKMNRTSHNLALMEVNYLRWKKEVEGEG